MPLARLTPEQYAQLTDEQQRYHVYRRITGWDGKWTASPLPPQMAGGPDMWANHYALCYKLRVRRQQNQGE